MKFLILVFLLFASCFEFTIAIYYQLKNNTNEKVNKKQAGEPLFLTPLIEKGEIALARQKAEVHHPFFNEFTSYSGYITVNKKYNSNTFMWFFPSQNDPLNDPVILWFIGGPGLSVMLAIIGYNGPFSISKDYVLKSREYHLTQKHNVIFIDNPIGSGFSFTDNPLGYARNLSDSSRDTITFLVQFFQLFPELRKNGFYIGGDSFGGKFVTSVGNAIIYHNYISNFYINLQGITIGNGLIYSYLQTKGSEFLYQIGLVDKKGRETYKLLENLNPNVYLNLSSMKADLFGKLTGFMYNQNFLYETNSSSSIDQYSALIETNSFRKAVHVGDKKFYSISFTVREFFGDSMETSSIPELEALLHYTRVLVYNGQLDLLFPYTSNTEMYENLIWPSAQLYKEAKRLKWYFEGDLVGYVKNARNFHEVLVRDAGHVTFMSQPKWSCELFYRFTRKIPIVMQGEDVTPSEGNPFQRSIPIDF